MKNPTAATANTTAGINFKLLFLVNLAIKKVIPIAIKEKINIIA